MSYDGGLSIKVVNSELLKMLKDHLKRGTFNGSRAIPEWIGTKHKRMTLAVDYEYWDCAYIDVCPRNLTQVLDAVISLFDEYADDISDYKDIKHKLYVYRNCNATHREGEGVPMCQMGTRRIKHLEKQLEAQYENTIKYNVIAQLKVLSTDVNVVNKIWDCTPWTEITGKTTEVFWICLIFVGF